MIYFRKQNTDVLQLIWSYSIAWKCYKDIWSWATAGFAIKHHRTALDPMASQERHCKSNHYKWENISIEDTGTIICRMGLQENATEVRDISKICLLKNYILKKKFKSKNGARIATAEFPSSADLFSSILVLSFSRIQFVQQMHVAKFSN